MMQFYFPVTAASLVRFTAQTCSHDGTLEYKLSVRPLGCSVQ